MTITLRSLVYALAAVILIGVGTGVWIAVAQASAVDAIAAHAKAIEINASNITRITDRSQEDHDRLIRMETTLVLTARKLGIDVPAEGGE